MPGVRKRGETVRRFILENVENHPQDIVGHTSKKFRISRAAVLKHIGFLKKQQAIVVDGTKRNRHYSLAPIKECIKEYALIPPPQEDVIWRDDVFTNFVDYPKNIVDIWHYCFTEIFNNAIDHSGGTTAIVQIVQKAVSTDIRISDNGRGIFKKIREERNLIDEQHAVLELSKGKLTTDPENHTGEGIFFSSRMMDQFTILSGNTFFTHNRNLDMDVVLKNRFFKNGTNVSMRIKNNSNRSIKRVFDRFTSKEDYGFSKTLLPVRLAQYGNELLASRSQAKRLLSRIENFKLVLFDFDGIEAIGQAFADEIFRVYAQNNPGVELSHCNANREVEKMIVHALFNKEV